MRTRSNRWDLNLNAEIWIDVMGDVRDVPELIIKKGKVHKKFFDILDVFFSVILEFVEENVVDTYAK